MSTADMGCERRCKCEGLLIKIPKTLQNHGGTTRPLPRMGAWSEVQQSGHAPWSGPDVRNGRISSKNGAPQKEVS